MGCGNRMQYLSSGFLMHIIAEQDYVPQVFEGYVADINVDGKNIALALWEFGGTIVLH